MSRGGGMADAHGLGPCEVTLVGVRLLSPAHVLQLTHAGWSYPYPQNPQDLSPEPSFPSHTDTDFPACTDATQCLNKSFSRFF